MLKFLLGISVGIIAGLVFAPARGEDMRQQLTEKAQELKQRGREKARQAGGEKGERIYDKVVGQ